MDLIKSQKLSKSSTAQDQRINPVSTSECVKAIKDILFTEYSSPSSGSIRYFIRRIFPTIESERKVDHFRPAVKRAFEQFIEDRVDDRLQLHDDGNEEKISKSDLNSVDCYGRVITQDICIQNEEFEKFFVVDVS